MVEPLIKWRSDGKLRGQYSGRTYEYEDEKGGECWSPGMTNGKPDFSFGKEKK
jgi:hypothetical protein